MSLIDCHVHLYPPEMNQDPARWAAERGEALWATMATRRRRSGLAVQLFPSVDELLREMDAAGVDRAVLQGWYWQSARSCEEQNRFYAECVRAHSDRLSAALTLFPAAGEAHVEREFAFAREAGFEGVGELSPHSQRCAIDHPPFELALRLAGEAAWPVTLHVTDPNARPYPGQIATPLDDFNVLARRHPGTSLILAHWGGRAAAAGGDAAATFAVPPNVYFDTAASPLSYDAGVWRRIVDDVGAGRVLFGSDFPLALYPGREDGSGLGRMVAEARGAGLSPREVAAVLGGNASRWFSAAPRGL